MPRQIIKKNRKTCWVLLIIITDNQRKGKNGKSKKLRVPRGVLSPKAGQSKEIAQAAGACDQSAERIL